MDSGCPTCHVIPGGPGAVGKVGPSLDALGQRSYLAGRLSNNRSNLQRWLMHPQSIEPGVAMPEMGVTQTMRGRLPRFSSGIHECQSVVQPSSVSMARDQPTRMGIA